MSLIAAVFGGQGSQYPGMGKSLYGSSERAREVYECAGDILGFDMAKISFEGSAQEITRTAFCQPALFTHAVAAWESASGRVPEPVAVAGHSVGEYAALYCAGSFSLEDGFRLIGARAKVMESAAESCPGTMVAVSGNDVDAIRAVCKSHGRVWAVNFNSPGQTVISGETKACLAAGEELAGMGMRTTGLKVASAFHTPLMQPAADELSGLISGINLLSPRLDFYSNLTGGLLKVESFADYFAKHMVSPVRFAEQVAAMSSAGIDTCIEYGAGKTAGSLAKKNNRALSILQVEDAQTLEKTAATLLSGVAG